MSSKCGRCGTPSTWRVCLQCRSTAVLPALPQSEPPPFPAEEEQTHVKCPACNGNANTQYWEGTRYRTLPCGLCFDPHTKRSTGWVPPRTYSAWNIARTNGEGQ